MAAIFVQVRLTAKEKACIHRPDVAPDPGNAAQKKEARVRSLFKMLSG